MLSDRALYRIAEALALLIVAIAVIMAVVAVAVVAARLSTLAESVLLTVPVPC